MLSLLTRHSSLLLMIAAICGFLFPSLSELIFPSLPYILFFLMLFTLLGMKQSRLIKLLVRKESWFYAFCHAGILSVISCSVSILTGAEANLTLAISAVAATGSLFATPAIARSVGLEPLKAMAMTITSTLLMPVVLYINLLMFSDNNFSLDIQGYLQRLTIFILGPMLISALCYRIIPHSLLHNVHSKLSQVTIILVLAFPFGLIGSFRTTFNHSLADGLFFLTLAVAICALFFIAGFFLYRHKGVNEALLAAITSANRNVLLTFTVAGSSLGPDYLVLMGALQLPTYCLPIVVKSLNRYLSQNKHTKPIQG